jgi:hypothetical protein
LTTKEAEESISQEVEKLTQVEGKENPLMKRLMIMIIMNYTRIFWSR